MKVSRIILIVVVIVVIAIIAIFAYTALTATTSSSTSSWYSAAVYPLQYNNVNGVSGQQCVSSSSYIYCVGGDDSNGSPRNAIYSSNPLSSSAENISSWTTDSNVYPMPINGASCVTFGNNIYCIGGNYDDAFDDTASSYFASLSNGVVGTWNSTTSYPIPIDSQSCVVSSGYVYCVGGNNETGGVDGNSQNSTSVYYASISNSGIGNWTLTNAYPSGVYYASCYASGGYIYCLGGADASNSAVNSVYYASLSSNGVGTWTQTTGYPASVSGQSCVIVSSTIYCVGGEANNGDYSNAVHYAPLSSSGVGAWKTGATYPDTVQTDCATAGGLVYCIGGADESDVGATGAVYFASLTSIETTTTA